MPFCGPWSNEGPRLRIRLLFWSHSHLAQHFYSLPVGQTFEWYEWRSKLLVWYCLANIQLGRTASFSVVFWLLCSMEIDHKNTLLRSPMWQAVRLKSAQPRRTCGHMSHQYQESVKRVLKTTTLAVTNPKETKEHIYIYIYNNCHHLYLL